MDVLSNRSKLCGSKTLWAMALFISLFSLLFHTAAHCLSFGEVKLYSYLNEPLEAEVELLGTEAIDSDQIVVSLASAQEFSRAGLERPFFLSLLRFEVFRTANHTFVKITSKDPIKQPYLDFLIDLSWPGGRLVRGYTLLLDPVPLNSGSVHEKISMEDPVNDAQRVPVLSASGGSVINPVLINDKSGARSNPSLSTSAQLHTSGPGTAQSAVAQSTAAQSKKGFETLFDPDVKDYNENPPIPPMIVVTNTASAGSSAGSSAAASGVSQSSGFSRRSPHTPSPNAPQASHGSQNFHHNSAQHSAANSVNLQNSLPNYASHASNQNISRDDQSMHNQAVVGTAVTAGAAAHVPNIVQTSETLYQFKITAKDMVVALATFIILLGAAAGIVFFIRKNKAFDKNHQYFTSNISVPNAPYTSHLGEGALPIHLSYPSHSYASYPSETHAGTHASFQNAGIGGAASQTHTQSPHATQSHSAHPEQSYVQSHTQSQSSSSAMLNAMHTSQQPSQAYLDEILHGFQGNTLGRQFPQHSHPHTMDGLDAFSGTDEFNTLPPTLEEILSSIQTTATAKSSLPSEKRAVESFDSLSDPFHPIPDSISHFDTHSEPHTEGTADLSQFDSFHFDSSQNANPEGVHPDLSNFHHEALLNQLGNLPGSDEMNLKLELAQNYLDMGEVEIARPLLDAVLIEGNEHQKQEAHRMLAEINPN